MNLSFCPATITVTLLFGILAIPRELQSTIADATKVLSTAVSSLPRLSLIT